MVRPQCHRFFHHFPSQYISTTFPLFSYDVVTLRYIYGHVTYTGMLHIRATLRNPNDTTTDGVSNYTNRYTVDMLKNPS